MKKATSFLLTSLLGISFSLQALPMDGDIGERASQPRPFLDRRENPTDSGSASIQATRGVLGGGVAESPAADDENPNAYLENEICNNIYTACLARVTDMTLGKISLPAGSSAKASARAEWEAAKEMAAEEEEEHKNAWEKAKRET